MQDAAPTFRMTGNNVVAFAKAGIAGTAGGSDVQSTSGGSTQFVDFAKHVGDTAKTGAIRPRQDLGPDRHQQQAEIKIPGRQGGRPWLRQLSDVQGVAGIGQRGDAGVALLFPDRRRDDNRIDCVGRNTVGRYALLYLEGNICRRCRSCRAGRRRMDERVHDRLCAEPDGHPDPAVFLQYRRQHAGSINCLAADKKAGGMPGEHVTAVNFAASHPKKSNDEASECGSNPEQDSRFRVDKPFPIEILLEERHATLCLTESATI